MNVVEAFQIFDQIHGRARLIQSRKKHEKLQFHTEERNISLLVLNEKCNMFKIATDKENLSGGRSR